MESLSLQKKFDLAKKEFEKGDINKGFFIAESNKTYNTHYTNSDWETYTREMQEKYHKAFDRYSELSVICKGSRQ